MGDDVIAVLGATGRTGGATARHLLERSARVRALLRTPQSEAARALRNAGAEVVAADMDDPESLRKALAGASRLFNVQPAFDDRGRYDRDTELRQGMAVAEAVRNASIRHVVMMGAGDGTHTGVPHLDSKQVIRKALEDAGATVTFLEAGPLMENMIDKDFKPSLSTFGAEPKVVGWDHPMPWVATDDIGRVAAERLTGPVPADHEKVVLIGDARSLRECHALLAAADRAPRKVPMPVFLFRKVAGDELPDMWKWIAETYDGAPVDSNLMDVPAWINHLQTN